jgi:hypothetical protein
MAAAKTCPGRTAKGGIKKGFRLVKGEQCPVKASPKTKSNKTKTCGGVHSSGPSKGKLKKGFTWRGSNGGCPVKSQ